MKPNPHIPLQDTMVYIGKQSEFIDSYIFVFQVVGVVVIGRMLMGTPHKVPWRHATHTSVNTCDDHRHFMSAVIPNSFEICDSLDVSRELDKNEYIVIIHVLDFFGVYYPL